ncbi:RCC1 domain-containing protein [Macrococcus brunensis]|uniref:RCC1 domain-containing protein n=1 Tax=Macrococcus brunensis TaxID=198483 RepID=UPI001EF016E7|nr:RCC1 domain-containing protein [Macrococcus brunensis]ULG72223.1 RCC1 domain-containing protein [Macrococcus brunensis]
MPGTINRIDAGARHILMINTDQSVSAFGKNTNGQCNVEDWNDIVMVSAGNVHVARNTGNTHQSDFEKTGQLWVLVIISMGRLK